MSARDPLPHSVEAGDDEREADLALGSAPAKPLSGADRIAELAEAHRRIGASVASWVAEGGTNGPFTLVPFADLCHTQPPAPAYAWEGLIPLGHVTGFAAHGGTGKSVVAIALAVSVATGRPLFGRATRQGPVVFFSGEDGKALLRYRLKFICKAMDVDIAELDGKLHILDATEGDPTLFAESNLVGQRIARTTSTFAALRAFCVQQKALLLVIDNASDAFDANENDRARVRAFMRALGTIARECEAGVFMLAHVDKGTSRQERGGAEAYSGSTAWHNSSRSRLFMRREPDGGLVIEHQKNNLGPLQEPIRLVWPFNGIPQEEPEPFGPYDPGREDSSREKWLLQQISEYSSRGEYIATSTNSRSHAAKVLRNEASFPKSLKDSRLFDMLRSAERAGYLQRVEIRGANRHRRECWQVTPAGAAFSATASKGSAE